MELSLYAATLAIGALILIATLLIGRHRKDRTVPALAVMESGMLLFVAQPFVEILGGGRSPMGVTLGMGGLVAFCAGGPAFSAAFYGKPLRRTGAVLRITVIAAALVAFVLAIIRGETPRLLASLTLYCSLCWMELEGLVAVLGMPRGKRRSFRAGIVAGTAAFLPFFVIDSAYGGGMFALPAFCIATSLVALVAVARKVSGPFGAEATESKSIAERFGLSPREAEVAALLADGLSNARIGERLFISTKTVETHVTNIYRKAGVDGRFAFLAKAGTAQ